MKRTLLIVDDEQDMLQLLRRSLEPDLACRVETAASGAKALDILKRQHVDLVLADIKMQGMSGLELLAAIKSESPDQTVIMMTAFGKIEIAVEAIKNGAYDFITKPFDHDTLVLRLEKALERSRLLQENQRLQDECRTYQGFQDMVGDSRVMKRVYETIRMVAKTDHTVLVTGESGTGKELAARAIHNLSPRSKGPFVAVNCPTVPENILERELYGYRKRAFTHASQNRIGLFQEAHRGTICLDEIGDVSPAIQTKLLRVLQEKTIKPLGDTKTVAVDVRIVASTNQDLREKIRRGEFREDFFYRLNVLPVPLPPLREHPEDIPLIASYLLEKHCAKLNKPAKKISPELMDILVARPWEGNVRELENIVTRGLLFSTTDEILPRDAGLTEDNPTTCIVDQSFHDLPYKAAKEETLTRFNNSYIRNLLTSSQGNVTQAAKRCGMERQALQQIMRRYGIKADEFRES